MARVKDTAVDAVKRSDAKIGRALLRRTGSRRGCDGA